MKAQKHCPAALAVLLLFIGVSNCNSMVDFHEDNWTNMLDGGEWMVEFFAPWCPACKSLAPTWERFVNTAAKYNVKVAKVDVTTSPSLSGRFFVTALPTIYHVINGEFRQYRGSRDIDALTTFVRDKQWNKLEPISAWKKPNTIHMSFLSYFFKLSHTLKDVNVRLQEEYGLPTWGSYTLLGIGTIFVGAALGLLLVCIVDFMYPPKRSYRQRFSDVKDNQNAIEDIANDELIDENAEEEEDGESSDENNEQSENDEVRTSEEEEKNSNNDDAEEEDDEKTAAAAATDDNENKKSTTTTETKSKSSPAEVRKRKPRKAD